MEPRLEAIGLGYLASPYSKYPGGLERAFIEASRIAGKLIEKGMRVYSPIAHCHPISMYAGLDPLNLPLWLDVDEAMMAKADALIVAHMTGWQESSGIAHEVAFFEKAGKPIYDLVLPGLEMARRTT